MPHDLTTAVGAAAFWMFVAVCVVSGMVGGVLRHRETQKTIRQAIEKGQTLDPATLDCLMQTAKPEPPQSTWYGMLTGGLIMICIGVGFAAMGWFTTLRQPEQFPTFVGIGCLIALIGVPLVIMSLVLRARDKGRRG